MKTPIKIAIKINGINTKNQDTPLYPALHIEFNTNVQKTI